MNEWMGQGQGNSGGGEGGLLELKCAKDADCFNGGTCDARGSKKCNCKNGTYSGILCEKMNPCNDQSICNGRGVCRSDKGDNTAEVIIPHFSFCFLLLYIFTKFYLKHYDFCCGELH